MLILALDTALDACSAAVYDTNADAFVSVETDVIGKGHAERLMAMLDAALTGAGIGFADLSRIAVTVGPGSFTGIRVGLATARGIGLAARLPVVGVSTLDSIAAEAPASTPVMVALDARRSEVYVARYDAARKPVGIAEILTVEDAAARLRTSNCALYGSGAPLVAASLGSEGVDVLGTRGWPDIRHVARLGALAADPKEPPAPLYLRAPDAKPQTRGRVERIGDAS